MIADQEYGQQRLSDQENDGDERFVEDDIEEFILKEYIKLFAKSSLPISSADSVLILIQKIVEQILSKINEKVTMDETKPFIENTIYAFKKFKSFSKIKEYLERKQLLVMPQPFLVANEDVQLFNENTANFQNLETHGMIMPIEQHVKQFLELPGVLYDILQYRDNILERKVDNCYEHLLHAQKWAEISLKYEGKNLIPITLYNDDFQVDDSSGPHSAKNSIAAFYYQISCLPPNLMSRIDFIFVALLAKAVDIKKHSPDAALYAIVEIFTKLETEGLLIETGDGKSHRIHFVLCNITGDNLGIHVICGFILSFGRSTYCCRFCNTPRSSSKNMHKLPE